MPEILHNSSMEKPDLFQKKFSILQEISNTVASSENISLIANLILDLAINYTNSEKGSLMLLNELGELSILSARGIDAEFVMTYRTRIGEGIAGVVAESREPVVVEDIESDDRFQGRGRDRYNTKSFISCPIVSKNRLHGVLNINDKKDNTPFTTDEFSLVKIVADQAAIALENASLMKELKEKANDLEETNKILIESDVLKTEFVMQVSHELRTPLNSINGAIYYLRNYEEVSKDSQAELYNVISEETTKLISIVENLLNYLQRDDESRIISKTVVSLRDLLRDVQSSTLVRNILRKRNVKLDVSAQDSVSEIVADKVRLKQFFFNLFEGLINWLHDGDMVRITLQENSHVQLVIMLPGEIPQAMLPYFSLPKYALKSNESEDKLKLYLALKIADLHQWRVGAENTADGFRLTLDIPKQNREKTTAVINSTMDLVTEFITDLLDVSTCSIMLADDLSGDLTIRSARGLPEEVIRRTRIRFSEKIAGWVAQEGKPLLIENIETDPRFSRINIPHYNTKSLLSVPLAIDDKVVGVINLNNKRSAAPFTVRDLHILSLLSERIARIVQFFSSNEFLDRDYREMRASFLNLIEVEQNYQKKHEIFSELVFHIMKHLGSSEEDMKDGLYLSIIYDLGLASVDKSILRKTQRLSPHEARTIRLHPFTTVSLLKDFEFSDKIKTAILHHHERYDGKGYPDKLKQDDIPFLSRVLAVVDAFCAMISKRPHKKKRSKEDALAEITAGSGTLYDPTVVQALTAKVDLLPDTYFQR
jgi:HD-GYP domain-containing protein (c-di-GMP phosphodiesterase class II)/signal transduction histidine kinase